MLRPAECSKKFNKIICLAWPYDSRLWGHHLADAQKEFLQLVTFLHRERVLIITPNEKVIEKFLKSFDEPQKNIGILKVRYGDIWIRDTFPIWVQNEKDARWIGIVPTFNGWGQKYLFDDDRDLAIRICEHFNIIAKKSDLVFEGGAVEFDGEGTLITTEQCLLNENRNPHVSKEIVEREFEKSFGVKKVIWLKNGLKNDHTDGHVDTLARFLSPGTIAIMTPTDKEDPNYEVLKEIKGVLIGESDARGRALKIVELPSPGKVCDLDGLLMPASFLNFIMGDHTLVMPRYGVSADREAQKILSQHTDRKVVSCMAKAILTGGGAFHCISQEIYNPLPVSGEV